MTNKLEQRLNQLMKNWWTGNLSDAERQLRALKKRELVHLLINQHRLNDGAWHIDNVVKLQDWVADTLDRV